MIEMVSQELELKKKLLQECTRILNKQISAAKAAMDDAQQSANEHQGAIEDKFESFREACHIQRDMYARQLDELITTMGILKRVNATKVNSEAAFGTVIQTDQHNYFIGVSLGEVHVDGVSYFAISGMSPLFKAISGKAAGERFKFREVEYKIQQVF